MRKVDGILNDVTLFFERGKHIDGRIGDQERPWVAGRVDDEDMACAAPSPQAVCAIDGRAHELIGMQCTFHQGLKLACACKITRGLEIFSSGAMTSALPAITTSPR